MKAGAHSLEGCCSIQLSYGTIGKTAPCGDDLRRKDRNFFHNSPRLNEKYHFPQGCNGLQPRGNHPAPPQARPFSGSSRRGPPCTVSGRKTACRTDFSANYFAGRNILSTFAGLKAQSG